MQIDACQFCVKQHYSPLQSKWGIELVKSLFYHYFVTQIESCYSPLGDQMKVQLACVQTAKQNTIGICRSTRAGRFVNNVISLQQFACHKASDDARKTVHPEWWYWFKKSYPVNSEAEAGQRSSVKACGRCHSLITVYDNLPSTPVKHTMHSHSNTGRLWNTLQHQFR